MTIEEAKEYIANTKITKIDLDYLAKACEELKDEPQFLINYSEKLGLYYKNINFMSWHNVLLYETTKPKEIYKKLNLIACVSYSSSNLNAYLSTVLDNNKSIAIAISKKEFDEIEYVFDFNPKDYYFGYCKNANKYIIYIIEK